MSTTRDTKDDLLCVMNDDGSSNESLDPMLSPTMLLKMYEEMLRVRLLDERMMARQRQGKIGFFGTITGQEATPIATAFATRHEDWIFPALRENAIMLCRGFPLTKWLAQVYGNAHDVLKGRQMPSHMSAKSVNQVAWSSCLGPQLPQAVGAAWAAKKKGHEAVSIGFVGDGATSEPDFHSAMNFASVFDVPFVLICQNNQWAISVPSSRQTASETFAIKARAYGMPGIRVDGNDVLALYVAIEECVAKARRGEGPSMIEALTYRIGPHSSSDDPTLYRDESEVEAWRQKDPLMRFERYLRYRDVLSDDQKQIIQERIQDTISMAIKEVEAYGSPALETLFEDVYESLPHHLRSQEQELLNGPRAKSQH